MDHSQIHPGGSSFSAMRTVEQHYAEHLASIYEWMMGGADAAFVTGATDLDGYIDGCGKAIDLGAGFGMHAIPLARAGYPVLAIDSSRSLLDQLTQHAGGLDVRCCQGDLRQFTDHLGEHEQANLILCMGDTLPHLDDEHDISQLAASIAERLTPGGRFLATFRDYRSLPQDDARFISVRSDLQRIHTCFLEDLSPTHVKVHDILHEWTDGKWHCRVSSYVKLRLDPERMKQIFEAAGLITTLELTTRRMIRLTAEASSEP